MSLSENKEWETVTRKRRKPYKYLEQTISDENQLPYLANDENQLANMTDAEIWLANMADNEIRDRTRLATELINSWSTEANFDVSIKMGRSRRFKNFSAATDNDEQTVVPVSIRNARKEPVYFSFEALELMEGLFTFKDFFGKTFKTLRGAYVAAGRLFSIDVHFASEQTGFYELVLLFTFQTKENPAKQYKMMRLIDVGCKTKNMDFKLPQDHTFSEQMPPTIKAAPPKNSNKNDLVKVVNLSEYDLPSEGGGLDSLVIELRQKPLNSQNYSWRFHVLLHLEEFHLQESLLKHNQADVLVTAHTWDIFILKIPNPSFDSAVVLFGSFANLVTKDDKGLTYTGIVHDMVNNEVFIKFYDEVPDRREFRCKVIFQLNRMSLRMQHRAASMAAKCGLMKLLFPTRRFPRAAESLKPTRFVFNQEQSTAILNIVRRSAKPAAYVLCGPPGTGKTLTLVKAIKEIIQKQTVNILACAPSNSATDNLCEKILRAEVGTDKVLRLYPLTHSIAKIPESIKKYCNLNQEKGTLNIPKKEVIMAYRILVTTMQTAGRLVSGGIPSKHYSYIFLDEAGQATETECLIPVAGLLDSDTCQLVLAGDPKQLGPVVISKIAEEHGLGLSLLERLMRHNSLYKPDKDLGFDSQFITKLLKNYRSHPSILKVPNDLFYNGELQPCARPSQLYKQVEFLPKEGFPVVFHSVTGISQQEIGSPSLYNKAEIRVIKDYLKSLITHLHRQNVSHIQPGEIGIISPYKKQVEKIKFAIQCDADLSRKNLKNVEVGTVDKFQGREFSVVLMSTVRTFPRLLHKPHFSLGFVKDERRFNVGMTRARHLLIVVGDPRLLVTDRNWNRFIHYCLTEGAYCGIPFFGTSENTPTAADAQALSAA